MSGLLSTDQLLAIREDADRFATNRVNAAVARGGVDLAWGSIFTRVAVQRADLLAHIDALQAELDQLRGARRLLHADSHGFVLTYAYADADDGWCVGIWNNRVHDSLEAAQETKTLDGPECEIELTICELMPVTDQ